MYNKYLLGKALGGPGTTVAIATCANESPMSSSLASRFPICCGPASNFKIATTPPPLHKFLVSCHSPPALLALMHSTVISISSMLLAFTLLLFVRVSFACCHLLSDKSDLCLAIWNCGVDYLDCLLYKTMETNGVCNESIN
jgi:hypothetical protein